MFSANYYRLELTNDDLRSLDADLAALVIATSFAVNEIAGLNKLMVAANAPKPSDDDGLKLHMAQCALVQRCLLIRVYEYLRLISDTYDLLRKKKNDDSATTRNVLAKEIKQVRRLRSGKAYKTAELIRNKLTGHIDLGFIKETLQRRKGAQKYEAIIHETQGNSLYLFAEDLAFMGLLGREDQGPTLSTEETIARYEGLTDWLLEASRACVDMHYSFLTIAVVDQLPHLMLEQVWVPIDEDRIGTLATDYLPIYWKTP